MATKEVGITKDGDQEEGAESGNNQAPHKVVDEDEWYFLHTIRHNYDHGHSLKFKCSLCNSFYVIVAKGRTYIICTDNIILIHLMICDK